MKPLRDDLLVRVLPEIVKKGEETKATDMLTTEIVKIGPDVKSLKVGDTVVFPPWGISNVVVGKEGLIVVNEGHIKLYDRKA